MKVEVVAVAGRAWSRAVRTLPDGLMFSVLFRLLAFAAVAPLVTALARGLLALGGKTVVANADILAFALSPFGLTSLLAVGAVLVGLVFVRFAGELAISYGAVGERRVTWAACLRVSARCAPRALWLGFAILLRLLVFLVPLVAVAAVVHARWLGEYDINYYLTVRPPEFWQAIAIVGASALLAAWFVIDRLVGWSLALPLVLGGRRIPFTALRESRRRLRGCRLRALLLLVGPPAAAAGIAVLLVAAAELALGFLLASVEGSLRVSAFLLGLITVVESVFVFGAAVVGSLAAAHTLAALHEALGDLPEVPIEGEPLPARPEWGIGARKVVFGVVAIAVGAFVVAAGLLSGVSTPDRVFSIAHRAGAAHAPENTLAALQHAIEAGADSAEIDVQRSSDGVVVVVHDRDLMKLAGRPWVVAETPLEQLRTADLGGGERIATLDEFIEAAGDRIDLCVELKYYGSDPELAEQVVTTLVASGVADRFEIMSLEKRAVEQVRRIAPEIRVGYLSAAALGDLLSVDVDFIAVAAGSANAPLIAAAAKRDLDVYVWTLNDADAISSAIDRGAPGIITDDPPLLARVLAERAELTAPERLLLRFGALR